tara:strand:- start:702 stop:971 length:270 start_codon:yes stop_codon:yes gene_type:complete
MRQPTEKTLEKCHKIANKANAIFERAYYDNGMLETIYSRNGVEVSGATPNGFSIKFIASCLDRDLKLEEEFQDDQLFNVNESQQLGMHK